MVRRAEFRPVEQFLQSEPAVRTEGLPTPDSRRSHQADASVLISPWPDGHQRDDGLLQFEPEPEIVFAPAALPAAGDAFVPLLADAVSLEPAADWTLEFSSFKITGEGISDDAAARAEVTSDRDFLKTASRGRPSARRSVIPRGTRLSIDHDLCRRWARSVVRSRRCTPDDLETLVSLCDGNGDPDDLRANLARTIEDAGIHIAEEADEEGLWLWDQPSDISPSDLAEAIEATLTRQTRPPGSGRFSMNKASEDQLVAPLERAKLELQLGVLASEMAIGSVLAAMDKVLDGSWRSYEVTLRAVGTTDPANAETAALIAATGTLREWTSAGKVMDGKRRREALQALEDLDLSPTFYAAMVTAFSEHETLRNDASVLRGLLTAFEVAAERLMIGHLPYARRFAARNTDDGEDPDDVFQVAFIGLQRAVRRFDRQRGQRFVYFSSLWMMQTLERWRGDEGAVIRVPIHRHQRIAELDQAIDVLDGRLGRLPSAQQLAEALEWPLHETEQFLAIPRHVCNEFDLDNLTDDDAPSAMERSIDAAAIAHAIAGVLSELPDREADIIRRRFGIDHEKEMTLQEIADIYGVTRERIRQIEDRALGRLSHPLRRRSLQTMCGRGGR